MAPKKMVVRICRQNHIRQDWKVDLESSQYDLFFIELADDLGRFGISLETVHDHDTVVDVNSYADLLNAVRISSSTDGFTNRCVGHIIGKSPHLDLQEDIKRAVNRVAFAPETVAPEDENRRVCHNCGCGC